MVKCNLPISEELMELIEFGQAMQKTAMDNYMAELDWMLTDPEGYDAHQKVLREKLIADRRRRFILNNWQEVVKDLCQ
jgi:hypothetical protein